MGLPEYCWCGEKLKSELTQNRPLSEAGRGSHRVYECPVHGGAWSKPDTDGGACQHIWTSYERTSADGMWTLMGRKCMACGVVKPGSSRRYPN